MIENWDRVAIAGASGTFKGVFCHGVLTAFERRGLTAAAYGGASSSTLSCSAAAAKLSEAVGLDYWNGALDILNATEGNLSEVVLQSISQYSSIFCNKLFSNSAPRLVISTSHVRTDEAAEQTQGRGARKLGKRLLINAHRKDNTWARENLESWLFDSKGSDQKHRLSPDNYDEVAYATTRMLHAWEVPATVHGVPFVDASYTNSCPAADLANLGYTTVIALSPEPEPVYTDIFRLKELREVVTDCQLYIITPDEDPAKHGVDFTQASKSGLKTVYEQGIKKGEQFLAELGCD